MLPYLVYKKYKARRRREREERERNLAFNDLIDGIENDSFVNQGSLIDEQIANPRSKDSPNADYIDHMFYSSRLGLLLEEKDGATLVKSVRFCSEAYRSGILQGDTIVAVNGSHTNFQRLLESSERPIHIRFCRNIHVKDSAPPSTSRRHQIQTLEAKLAQIELENNMLHQRIRITEGNVQEISKGLLEVEECDFLKSVLEKALQQLEGHKMKLYRKKIEMEAHKDFMLCVICQDRDRGSRLNPCGHVVLCVSCASSPLLRACPVCRAAISGFQPCFLA